MMIAARDPGQDMQIGAQHAAEGAGRCAKRDEDRRKAKDEQN